MNSKRLILKKHCFFLSIVLCFNSIFCPNSSWSQTRTIDSLLSELNATKVDSIKLRLHYQIAEKQWLMRSGFWDSLIFEAHRLNLPKFESRSYLKLAYILLMQNRDTSVLTYLNKAHSIAVKTKDTTTILSALHAISNYHYLTKNNNKTALQYCYKAIKLGDKSKNTKKMASIYSLLGEIYFQSGNPEKAISAQKKCLELSEECGDHFGYSQVMTRLGEMHKALNDTANAIQYFLKSGKYIDELGNSLPAIQVNLSLGEAHELRGEFSEARPYYEKALLISKEKSQLMEPLILNNLSNLNFKKGEYNLAEKQALQALLLIKKSGLKHQRNEVAELLKDIYLKKNDFKKAYEYYSLAVSWRDSLTNENNSKEALQKEFNYALEKKDSENKLLAAQNQIQMLQLNQSKYLSIGIGVAAVLTLLVAFLYFRQNRLKKEQENSKLEQKLLRSQMNPHFIFNSLQTIQNYILKHDEKDAVKYLSSFASITRDVLENSRLEEIPLQREIELLENYLLLQKMRFKDKFDYTVSVDSSVDKDNTLIPPMLSQPFIENAVEHGFHGIEQGGKITVRYFMNAGKLELEILDNGVGMSGDNASTKKHRSLALEITKERIELMNKKRKEKVLFHLTEGLPQETERKGVRVSFSFPVH